MFVRSFQVLMQNLQPIKRKYIYLHNHIPKSFRWKAETCDGKKINRSTLDEARAAGIACLEQARNEDRRLQEQGEDVNAAWVSEEASNQVDNISLGAGNDENKPPSTPHIGSLNHNDLNQAGAASTGSSALWVYYHVPGPGGGRSLYAARALQESPRQLAAC